MMLYNGADATAALSAIRCSHKKFNLGTTTAFNPSTFYWGAGVKPDTHHGTQAQARGSRSGKGRG